MSFWKYMLDWKDWIKSWVGIAGGFGLTFWLNSSQYGWQKTVSGIFASFFIAYGISSSWKDIERLYNDQD